MKFRKYIFIYIIVILLFSCNKKKENYDTNVQQKSIDEQVIKIEAINDNGLNKPVPLDEEIKKSFRSKATATEEEVSNAKHILETNYYRAVTRGEKINYIKKVNMGLQGGDNWLALWTEGVIECYSISSKSEILARYTKVSNLDNSYIKKHTSFDIMKDIPGERIGTSSCMVGDYNNDGLDEVLNFCFGGSWWGLQIYGYDKQKDEFVSLAEVPFDIIDRENGPSPVEFMIYNGMNGFKVYYCLSLGTPEHLPKNIINEDYAWYFFTWDEKQRKFVEVCELIE
jgi:hypothetical protein